MPEKPLTTSMAIPCGACGRPAGDRVGTIPFYLPDHDITTTIWRCIDCGTYSREIDLEDPNLKRHFDVASYTDPLTEARFRTVRSGYFVYLSELLEKCIGRSLHGSRVLDVGTAYGHFLERLKERGALAEGVEIVAALRTMAAQRGLVVHERIPDGRYDVVAIIDSLYYSNDPLTILRRARGVLAPGGCLLLRVTNRTWLLDLLRQLGVVIHKNRFGDAKYNFSPGGMIQLLERAGFRVEDVIWEERGKADTRWMIRSYYQFSQILCKYLSLRVTPGMLIVARRSA